MKRNTTKPAVVRVLCAEWELVFVTMIIELIDDTDEGEIVEDPDQMMLESLARRIDGMYVFGVSMSSEKRSLHISHVIEDRFDATFDDDEYVGTAVDESQPDDVIFEKLIPDGPSIEVPARYTISKALIVPIVIHFGLHDELPPQVAWDKHFYKKNKNPL